MYADVNSMISAADFKLGSGAFGTAISTKEMDKMHVVFKVVKSTKYARDEAEQNKRVFDVLPQDILQASTCITQDSTFVIVPPITPPFADPRKIPNVITYSRGQCLFQDTRRQLVPEMYESVLYMLNHMHMKAFSHNDIKPENFVWDGKQLKSIDFGLSDYFSTKMGNRFAFPGAGTPVFMSPMQLPQYHVLNSLKHFKSFYIGRYPERRHWNNDAFFSKWFAPSFFDKLWKADDRIIKLKKKMVNTSDELKFLNRMLCKVDEFALALSIMEMNPASNAGNELITQKLTDYDYVINDWLAVHEGQKITDWIRSQPQGYMHGGSGSDEPADDYVAKPYYDDPVDVRAPVHKPEIDTGVRVDENLMGEILQENSQEADEQTDENVRSLQFTRLPGLEGEVAKQPSRRSASGQGDGAKQPSRRSASGQGDGAKQPSRRSASGQGEVAKQPSQRPGLEGDGAKQLSQRPASGQGDGEVYSDKFDSYDQVSANALADKPSRRSASGQVDGAKQSSRRSASEEGKVGKQHSQRRASGQGKVYSDKTDSYRRLQAIQLPLPSSSNNATESVETPFRLSGVPIGVSNKPN
jgi:serine/threonine protein kinase